MDFEVDLEEDQSIRFKTFVEKQAAAAQAVRAQSRQRQSRVEMTARLVSGRIWAALLLPR
jgi:hypothetical protein